MNNTDDTRPLIQRIEADPLNVPLYHQLAELYASDGHFRKAELVLQRAIDIAPLTRETWSRLGRLLGRLGKWSPAVDALERAAELGPETADDSIALAFALLANQAIRQAERVSNHLLEVFPQRAESHLIAGHIAKVHGDFDGTVDCYSTALGLDPALTEAAYHLADLAPEACSKRFTQQLEAKRNDRGLTPGQRADVLFALARVYEHAGRVEATFDTLCDANEAAQEALSRSGQGYDAEEIWGQASEITTTFTAGMFPTPLEPIDLGIKLIFIVGLPRSGTTLIERILSAHPQVQSGGELPFMHECLEKYLAARRAGGRSGAVDVSDVAERQLLVAVRQDYLDRIFERDLDADYVIDKLPANFTAVGLIRLLFPDASIVHCQRDPIATCWSLFRSHFGIHASYSTSFKQLAHYYRTYARLAAHWRDVLKAPMSEMHYETIVSQPERSIRGLLDACGLEWSETCLRFEENAAPVYTASGRDVRRPLYDTSTSRWKEFSRFLAPLAQELAPYAQAYSAQLECANDPNTLGRAQPGG